MNSLVKTERTQGKDCPRDVDLRSAFRNRPFSGAMPIISLLSALLVLPAMVAPTASFASSPRLEVPEGFSGVVLVARGPRILLFQASGNAGRGPIKRDSKFWIASCGKQFVAAAVMKLAERGRLRLDDSLDHFFPEVPPDKAAITIRQLLSHTSGFDQSYVSEAQTKRDAAVQRIFNEPLAGQPGDKFRYSNLNIQLAAAIVDIASGMPYAAYMKHELWGPAGLRATGIAGDAGAASVTATTGQLPTRLQRRYWGEQGAYSTAPDLLRWYRALAAGRIIRPVDVYELFRPRVKIGEGYATLGWFRGKTKNGDDFLFVRGNEDFGANALLYAYPKEDLEIIVLTHAGDAPGHDMSWSRYVQQSLESQLHL